MAVCQNGAWVDPLAQSFLIDIQGGIFITKLDLYFSAKDTVAPVYIQVREMENGYPTTTVLSGSEIVKLPSQVNISTTGLIATTFTFEHPIFLEENTEYCFVVLSTSPNYRCFVSELGKNDITSGSLISKQPYYGSLFKSQNSTTWTAEQMEDLKFKLYRAKFNVADTMKLVFNNDVEHELVKLQDNPFETYLNSNLVRVYHPGHNYVVGDKVRFNILTETWYRIIIVSGTIVVGETLTCPTGSIKVKEIKKTTEFYTHNSKAYSIYQVKFTNLIGKFGELVQYVGGTSLEQIKNQRRVSSIGIPTSKFATTKIVSTGLFLDAVDEDLNGIPITEINKASHTVQAVDSYDSYIIQVNVQATATGRGYGTGNYAECNKQVDEFRIRLNTNDHNFVSSWSYEGYSHSGIGGGFDNYSQKSGKCLINKTTELEQPLKIATNLNEITLLSDKSISIVGEYNPYSFDNLSPVIDLESANITVITNIINNMNATDYNIFPIHDTMDQFVEEDSEEDINNGMHLSKYLSQVGTLQIPATSLKIFIDCYKNIFSTIEVYYRIVSSSSEKSIDESVWVYAPFDTDFICTSDNEFIEGEISVEDIEEFKAYQLKAVFKTSNTAKPPKIKNLRTIALT